METVFRPSHKTLKIDETDFHIPTATTTTEQSFHLKTEKTVQTDGATANLGKKNPLHTRKRVFVRIRSLLALLPAVFVLIPTPIICQGPRPLSLSGDYPVTHDPSIAREGHAYYVFATTSNPNEGQFPIRCSRDLLSCITLSRSNCRQRLV
jgi:hypothetical protein